MWPGGGRAGGGRRGYGPGGAPGRGGGRGRSPPPAPAPAARAADLAAAGTGVEVIACDVGERGDVAGLLARIAGGGAPLTAVMHTAGILDDGRSEEHTSEL